MVRQTEVETEKWKVEKSMHINEQKRIQWMWGKNVIYHQLFSVDRF